MLLAPYGFYTYEWFSTLLGKHSLGYWGINALAYFDRYIIGQDKKVSWHLTEGHFAARHERIRFKHRERPLINDAPRKQPGTKVRIPTGKSYWKGSPSTIDLLGLTNLDGLVLHWKCWSYFLQNNLPWWGGQLYWAFPLS